MKLKEGNVAVVTGGNAGIGKSIANKLTQLGVHTIICARREEEGLKTVEEFSGRKGNIFFKKCDVSKTEDIDIVFSEIRSEFGRLDYAVNNAAIGGVASRLDKYPEKVFDRVINVNVKGCWNCMRGELPLMLETGGGSIVNVSSIAGINGADWLVSPYSASKHAVIGLTKSAALEFARKNIRINAVCPGFIRTEMLEDLFKSSPDPKKVEEEITKKHPVHRLADPDEVADAVIFLLSENSSFITGTAIPVDGGYSAV
ncbi:MAG: glucose 1-dehydrogenase [Leptospira sp.]|nr:glucose 1-dehydrogenase [Leptospira sp.]